MLRSALYNLLAPTKGALVERILGLDTGSGFISTTLLSPANRRNVWPPSSMTNVVSCLRVRSAGRRVSFHQPGRRILDNRVKLNCLNTYDWADYGRSSLHL